MSNVTERHRKTHDEHPQPKAEMDLMFQFLSETSQKETLKARGGDDSVLVMNAAPTKLS